MTNMNTENPSTYFCICTDIGLSMRKSGFTNWWDYSQYLYQNRQIDKNIILTDKDFIKCSPFDFIIETHSGGDPGYLILSGQNITVVANRSSDIESVSLVKDFEYYEPDDDDDEEEDDEEEDGQDDN